MKNPSQRTALCVLIFLVSALTSFAQGQDFSKVEIEATKVAGTVYMLKGAGGNIGVSAGEDGIVIVDDQFAPLAGKIKEALKGIADKPVKFVIKHAFSRGPHRRQRGIQRDGDHHAQENVRKRLQAGWTVAKVK